MHTGQLPSFLDRMGMDLQERKHRLKVPPPPTALARNEVGG